MVAGVRLSTAKFLPPDKARDMQAARDLASPLGKRRKTIRLQEHRLAPAQDATPEPPRPTVEMAVAAYRANSTDRGNSDAILQKKAAIFEHRTHEIQRIELERRSLQTARASYGSVSGPGWLPRNDATELTKGLGKIQVKAVQTGYFQPSEYKAIIDATYAYSDRPSVDRHNSLNVDGHRIRALAELMRWTGLRIRDAVTLEKRRHSTRSGERYLERAGLSEEDRRSRIRPDSSACGGAADYSRFQLATKLREALQDSQPEEA